ARGHAQAHSIRVDAAAHSIVGEWDADRLSQVLANLLSNAIKYSPGGGEILVRVEDHGSAAEITVRDHGVGMDRDVIRHLFDRFYRGAGTATAVTGLGLGLYITKELVEAHGGRIRAESDGPGLGSTFRVTLPHGQAV